MTGKEVRRHRVKLGLKQSEFAKLIGVHWVTVSRWETEAIKIPEPMARFLRLVTEKETRTQSRRGSAS